MKKQNEPFRKIGAIVQLFVYTGGLLLFIWGASAEFANLRADVKRKASKSEVQVLEHKIDKVILGLCIINEKACILKDN